MNINHDNTSIDEIYESKSDEIDLNISGKAKHETTRSFNDRTPLYPASLESELSYERGLIRTQRRILNQILAVVGVAFLSFPISAAFFFGSVLLLLFAILVTWRATLVFVGVCIRMTRSKSMPSESSALEVPVYSILVPLYQEVSIIPQLASALSRLDWPAQQLDIQILLEADDHDTIGAALAAAFPIGTRITRIPTGGPRTKPNALNFGLARAHGRYVTVYDAEDLPDPDQLRAAYRAFQTAPDDLVCVQAPLIGEPSRGSWLSSQWALEYAVQFGLLLPSLALYRMPLLIGGTSNHFKRSALLALGGWDPWNVTEDADLGMRIARAGLSCGTISTPTYEDAPTRWRVWFGQRSRWIKGYIQTWLVLMRTPRKTLAQMRPLPFLLMQVTLGGAILAPLFHAPCLGLVIVVSLAPGFELGIAGMAVAISAVISGFIGDVTAPGQLSRQRWFAILTRPLYWPLHSLAAYQAIWELATKPFFWAKTPHTPRTLDEAAFCSIGSSPPAPRSPSSRSGFSPTPNKARSGRKISARIKCRGD